MAASDKDQNEYRAATGNLKRALKQRGITYRDLAQGIALSESGVKKIFLARDGSFQRLSEICRYIGLSLSEIVDDGRTLEVGFSERQQRDFLRDPMLFQFYWLLVYERLPLPKAQDALKLSKAEGFRLARKLDVLGLIKLLPRDRLRLPSVKAVRWSGDGEFMRMLYLKWSRALVAAVAKPTTPDQDFFLLRYLQMTPQTYVEFTRALRSIEEEFVRRSIQEMRIQAPVKHVRWLVAADNRSFVTDDRLGNSVT